MKIIPILRCSDIRRSVAFYTTILDFKLKYPNAAPTESIVVLLNQGEEIVLSTMEGSPKTAIYICVENVDHLYNLYQERGLRIPNRPESPVHTAPIDQTWGLREFYIDDPDGNTLRFATPML